VTERTDAATAIRASRGAFPTLVLERLDELGVRLALRTGQHAGQTSSARRLAGAELHPLDFEWYFAQQSSDEIADMLIGELTSTDRLLLLGAPTVAMSRFLRSAHVTLIDRNSLLPTRWPSWPQNVRLVLRDLNDPFWSRREKFGAAFFDAPWYPDAVLRWLQQASRLVCSGGPIGFILFPELTRPSALEERQRILDFARSLGRVHISLSMIRYETPLFEAEALKAAGVEALDQWRLGDLVLVENARPFRGHLTPLSEPGDEWDTYLIGSQVVKLRHHITPSELAVSRVTGCRDYILPSVSARDARRAAVGLWTSRNRVAQIGNRRLIANLLDHFATFGVASKLPSPLRRHADVAAELALILA
jgi:hypothetical protein